jgi:hypothetical protein
VTRLLALFLLAIGIRLLYIQSTPPESPIGSTDAWGYHRLALNLDRGNGFSLRREAPFVPDGVRTPLYPLFLLLVRRSLGPSARAAVAVQALLDGFTTLCTYTLAVRTMQALGNGPPIARRAGRAAALLYALNPTQIRMANELLTETTLSLLLACGLNAVLQVQAINRDRTKSSKQAIVRSSILAGLLAGLSALCKPNAQFLPLIWIPCIALAGPQRDGGHSRQPIGAAASKQPIRAREAGLVAISFFVVLSPWVARNAIVFGRPFLSTAFEGNVSRVSAPATTIVARGEHAIPWSDEWEAAFGEIVSEAATRYGWDKPWTTLSARELDVANRQVYRVAREQLARHPLAWAQSHLLGTLRYLEPQSYRILHHSLAGRPWPPDILEDAVLHAVRAAARGQWSEVIEIVGKERWNKLTLVQRKLWWGTFLTQVAAFALMLHGARRLARRPLLAVALAGTIAYVLLIPGPIAYERFRTPVLSPILALIAVALTSPHPDAGRSGHS